MRTVSVQTHHASGIEHEREPEEYEQTQSDGDDQRRVDTRCLHAHVNHGDECHAGSNGEAERQGIDVDMIGVREVGDEKDHRTLPDRIEHIDPIGPHSIRFGV